VLEIIEDFGCVLTIVSLLDTILLRRILEVMGSRIWNFEQDIVFRLRSNGQAVTLYVRRLKEPEGLFDNG